MATYVDELSPAEKQALLWQSVLDKYDPACTCAVCQRIALLTHT